MLAYILRRLWQMVPTLFGVMLLLFILFSLPFIGYAFWFGSHWRCRNTCWMHFRRRKIS